ncbi:MAG: hypothetical protein VB119_06730 [Candidatus Metalachnospira sp.]|nr:hypothetical protein [Bacteroidaceae bacterium]MEA4972863.1 hypothetical protein [Candidatus Metalachnospira sp.]
MAAEQISDSDTIIGQTIFKQIIDSKYCLVVNTEYAIGEISNDNIYGFSSYTYKL